MKRDERHCVTDLSSIKEATIIIIITGHSNVTDFRVNSSMLNKQMKTKCVPVPTILTISRLGPRPPCSLLALIVQSALQLGLTTLSRGTKEGMFIVTWPKHFGQDYSIFLCRKEKVSKVWSVFAPSPCLARLSRVDTPVISLPVVEQRSSKLNVQVVFTPDV